MRKNIYYGTLWISLEGITDEEEDRISIKFENQFRTKPCKFDLISLHSREECFGFTLVNFSISIYYP